MGGSVLAQNQIADLSFESSHQEVQIDENFDIFVQLKVATDQDPFAIESVHIPGLENFKILKNESAKTFQSINQKMAIVSEVRYTILPTKTGTFNMGPIRIKYKGKNGKMNTLRAEALTITVGVNKDESPVSIGINNSPANRTDRISSEMQVISNDYFWMQIAGLIAGLGILMGILIAFTPKKKKERLAVNPETISFPPLKKDLNPESEGYWAAVDAYLNEFSHEAFGGVFESQTSQELLLKSSDRLNTIQYEKLSEILSLLDQQKYAGKKIDPSAFHEKLISLLSE